MEYDKILDAVKRAREGATKKNFAQSFDLAVNFKDLDLKNPSHKVKEEIVLPSGRGKAVVIGAIVEGELAEKAKKAGIKDVLGKDDLGKLAKNKRTAKKLVSNTDFFIASPDLMAEVGKTLGPVLGPKNKMPQPVPPTIPDLKPILERLNRLVRVRVKDHPVIHCVVGTEEMGDDDVAKNVDAVLKALERKLPKGATNIKSVFVKTTMGKTMRVEQ